MNTQLIAHLLEQREVIHTSDIEVALSKESTILKNDALLDVLKERMEGVETTAKTFLECLRLGDPQLADEVLPIERCVLWVSPSPEAAAVIVDELENTREVEVVFGPVEHDPEFLYRRCCWFNTASIILIVVFPKKDGQDAFRLAVESACKKWSTITCLLVYSGTGVGMATPERATIVFASDELLLDKVSQKFSCSRLPCCSEVRNRAPSCVIDPYFNTVKELASNERSQLLLCTTTVDSEQQFSSDAALQNSIDVCTYGSLTFMKRKKQ